MMTEWLKWVKSTNMGLLQHAGPDAEGIVIDKNSFLYGTSIPVEEKESKVLGLSHWGRLSTK